MQTLINVVEDAAKFSVNSKRRIKVVLDKRTSYEISYEELVKKARRVALTFQQRGVKKGDKIIYQIINPYHFIQMYWGCIYAGIIPVPITTPMNRSKKSEAYLKTINVYEQLGQPLIVVQERLYDIYKDLNNSVIIVEDFLSDLVGDKNGIIEEVTENDIAFIQFSSGSTGFPKGVVLRHKNLVANIQQIVERIEVTPEDRICNWMPLTHDMGLIGFHLATIFAKGNQDIMMPDFFIRYTTEFMQYIADNKISIIGSPNFGIEWMLKRVSGDRLKDDSLKCLRGIFDGAEPIDCRITKKFLERFAEYGLQDTVIYSSYGLAEACVAIAISDIRESFKTITLDWEKFTSNHEISILKDSEEENREIEFAVIGKPLNGVEIKIIGDLEEESVDNQVGEICVKGKNITEGYFNHPFNNEYITRDGYLKTGDLGFIDRKSVV